MSRCTPADVTVSRKNLKADAIVRADKDLFDRIVTGHENAMAARAPGRNRPQGDVSLLLRFARLFPGPPRKPEPANRVAARSST